MIWLKRWQLENGEFILLLFYRASKRLRFLLLNSDLYGDDGSVSRNRPLEIDTSSDHESAGHNRRRIRHRNRVGYPSDSDEEMAARER